jgi:hypothetical protein
MPALNERFSGMAQLRLSPDGQKRRRGETGRWQVSSNGGKLSGVEPYRRCPLLSRRARTDHARGCALLPERRPGRTAGGASPVESPRPCGVRRLAADGTQLLMVQETKTDEQRAASLAVGLNWFAEFRK